MRLTIIPSEGKVNLNGEVLSDLDLSACGIPSDIHALQWSKGIGHIEYAHDTFTEDKPDNEDITKLPDWATKCISVFEAWEPPEVIVPPEQTTTTTLHTALHNMHRAGAFLHNAVKHKVSTEDLQDLEAYEADMAHIVARAHFILDNSPEIPYAPDFPDFPDIEDIGNNWSA